MAAHKILARFDGRHTVDLHLGGLHIRLLDEVIDGAYARGYRIIHREIGSRGAILKFVRDTTPLGQARAGAGIGSVSPAQMSAAKDAWEHSEGYNPAPARFVIGFFFLAVASVAWNVRDNVALSITLWCLAALLLTFAIAVGPMVRREARVKRQIVEDFHQQSAPDVPPPPPPPPYRNPTTPEEN
ncbi:hypothetical protein [Streptomyces triticirhizae]|uniref:Uncharacterized protein n=1 Tax=Streptomyces triticirhizae TaxID=2483353 RepID=A0A3M2LFH2_9ACTN|nr:hypothetical protein [Streptomyces triticirhizae]RMI36212.1 hypothetical protein EBN88_22095 [Streptomyces triticirhizae]